jgi:adenine-specific DNA-methyltransferase
VEKGELVVTGEKKITQRTDGLGGSFTYCTLGEPLELDRLLTGETLPSFEALAAVLFHMASNEAFDASRLSVKDGLGYLGASSAYHMWLIYKPELEFLKSAEAALTLKLAESLVKKKKDGKRHLVFAPARFVSQKMLNEASLPVEFAPLPFALYRIERR